MGYYTGYTLTFTPGESDAIVQAMEEMDNELLVAYDGNEEQTWYDYERDMIAFSKRFPNTLFKLVGIGTNNDDMWCAWYQNGEGWEGIVKIIWPTLEELKAGSW